MEVCSQTATHSSSQAAYLVFWIKWIFWLKTTCQYSKRADTCTKGNSQQESQHVAGDSQPLDTSSGEGINGEYDFAREALALKRELQLNAQLSRRFPFPLVLLLCHSFFLKRKGVTMKTIPSPCSTIHTAEPKKGKELQEWCYELQWKCNEGRRNRFYIANGMHLLEKN